MKQGMVYRAGSSTNGSFYLFQKFLTFVVDSDKHLTDLEIFSALFSGKKEVKTVKLISFLALAVAYQAFLMLRILGTFLSHVDGSLRILGYQHLDSLKACSVADHRDRSGPYYRFGHKLS
jgi:hypothetical protein